MLLAARTLVLAQDLASLGTVAAGDSIVALDSLVNGTMPLLIVNTVDGEEPTCEPIAAPEGCIGNGITNVNKVKSSLVMILGGDTIYDSGEYVKDESGMTIKIRGNSSAYLTKKSYKIKLQKKADLLHRGDDATYKDKEWVLLTNEGNYSNHRVGFIVSRLMGFGWTPACEFVNVVLNGAYKGIYLLAEPVKRNESCRIDVDEDTGYIIEFDPYWWNEDVSFESTLANEEAYTFKYPDSDDVTDSQIEYIQGAVGEMEESLFLATYPDHIDMESFARWVLTHDLLGTLDGAGSNIFLSKYDDTRDSKFCMETPWDFDSIEQMEGEWSSIHDSFCFDKLFSNEQNTAFLDVYCAQWSARTDAILKEINCELDSLLGSGLAEAMDRYAPLDVLVSDFQHTSFEDEIQVHKDWFNDRKLWLDRNVPNYNIHGMTFPYLSPSNTTYDTQGRAANSYTRGIVIWNHRKFRR